MDRRDIVIGIIIIALLGGFIYFRQQRADEEEKLRVPQTLSVEDKIEDAFKVEIPEDVDKAELKDVAGEDTSAIATRKFENARFTHTVLADLPDPEMGSFYEGWLVKEDEVISTGRFSVAKGGYLLEFSSNTDYSEYSDVVITLEKVADKNPEKHILEGSF